MKNQRQKVIYEIISQMNIETQSDLLDQLKKRGFEVTQGTLSRDIREMGIIKLSTRSGKSRYYLSESGKTNRAKFDSIVKHLVIGVDYAVNIVVIKTYSGMANAAAAALDSMEVEERVGSIAGDDTIMVVMRSEKSAEEFKNSINNIIE